MMDAVEAIATFCGRRLWMTGPQGSCLCIVGQWDRLAACFLPCKFSQVDVLVNSEPEPEKALKRFLPKV